MDYNLLTNVESCHIELPNLLYYSHWPSIIISLFFGIFVYYKSGRSLAGKILLSISFLFFFWAILNLITWVTFSSQVYSFFWSFFEIILVLLFCCVFYFVYAFIEERDFSFKVKLIFFCLYLPILIVSPWHYLIGFDTSECSAIMNNGYLYCIYILKALVVLATIFLLFFEYKKYYHDEIKKKKIIFVGIGSIFLLLSILVTQYFTDLVFDNYYEIEFYGLFAIDIFVGFLVYLIVKYRAFEIKLIGAQALMVSLVILVGSQFFFVKTPTNMVLTGIALVLSVIFGFFLIKSVKSEIQRKEELQYMADKLAQSNDKLRQLDNAKTEFISIASHQLRTPLTAIKGFIALILEGSYGDISSGVSDALIKAQVSTERLINLVEDLLNVSRIESGRMEYKMVDQDITKLLMELDGSFAIVSKNKGLSFETKLPTEKLPNVSIDDAKMREVISNLIDNALKYTEKGGVTVRVERGMTSTFKSYGENEVNKQAQQYQGNARPSTNGYIRVIVSDTGIGIPATELPYLFSKFSRGKDATRLHVGGTGLGLYVGKNIVEAHGGKVWAESDGDGLGSRFIVELPVV